MLVESVTAAAGSRLLQVILERLVSVEVVTLGGCTTLEMVKILVPCAAMYG